jgi:hypothetical protein
VCVATLLSKVVVGVHCIRCICPFEVEARCLMKSRAALTKANRSLVAEAEREAIKQEKKRLLAPYCPDHKVWFGQNTKVFLQYQLLDTGLVAMNYRFILLRLAVAHDAAAKQADLKQEADASERMWPLLKEVVDMDFTDPRECVHVEYISENSPDSMLYNMPCIFKFADSPAEAANGIRAHILQGFDWPNVQGVMKKKGGFTSCSAMLLAKNKS